MANQIAEWMKLHTQSSAPSPQRRQHIPSPQRPAPPPARTATSERSPRKLYHSVRKRTIYHGCWAGLSRAFYCSSTYKRWAFIGSSPQHSVKLFWSPACTKLVWGWGEAYSKNQRNFCVATELPCYPLIKGQLYTGWLSDVVTPK